MLEGVVVSKADGQPVSGATVAMAHADKAYIFVQNEAEVVTWGPTEKRLFFIPKRNGKTACDTTTDEQGRFTLKSFVSMSAKYSVVAGSQKAGLAILENVRPNDYAEKPLRIEIDEPAYLEVPSFPKPADETLMAYTYVQLEPELPEATTDVAEAVGVMRQNIYLSVMVPPAGDGAKSRAGPLVGGMTYRVGNWVWGKRFGAPATRFETVVKAEPGKTVPVQLSPEGGTALSGRITLKEGSPLRDVNVMVKIGEGAKLVLGALTDEKGDYTIANVPSGSHKLELLRHAVRVGPG
jgi:hypothetical protein